MKVVGFMCLAAGLCSLPLAGQQHVPRAGRSASYQSSDTVHIEAYAVPPAQLPDYFLEPSAATPALGRPSVVPGFPAATSIESMPSPVSPAISCTQAAPFNLLDPDDNAFQHLNFSTTAVKATFAREHLREMAENFVPGATLPHSPSYVALTSRQKFHLFLKRSYAADTFTGSLFDSLYAQATGAYPEFGGGMQGYGKRLGISAAGAEASVFFGDFLFPSLLHTDPRYFRSNSYAISDRMAYAASRVIITRSDNGTSVLNTPLILSELVTAALANAYRPYRNETVPGTLENALAGLGSVAQSNILMEFWPDIKAMLRQHSPKSVRRWETRIDDINWGQRANPSGDSHPPSTK